MSLTLNKFDKLLIRWQKEECNPYMILRIAIENNGIITIDHIQRKAPSIASPRAALNALTHGMKICYYPLLERKRDKETYVIRSEFLNAIRTHFTPITS